MTEEKLKRMNEISGWIKWANEVLCYIMNNDRLSLYFHISESCIEEYRIECCPEWLTDIIRESISNKRQEWIREFEEM